MAFAKFQENRFRNDEEIAENHTINKDRMIFSDFSVNFEPFP